MQEKKLRTEILSEFNEFESINRDFESIMENSDGKDKSSELVLNVKTM